MNNTKEWKWKRWDVRSDGKVFWCYGKSYENNQNWVTWEQALKNKLSHLTSVRIHRKTDKYKKKINEWRRTPEAKAYYRKYQNSWQKFKISSDPMFAVMGRLRARIRKAITKKGYTKRSKTNHIIGCSWEDLKTHIESRFTNGMTWENRHLWHIDHIIPLASATSEEDLIKLNHYTNLQPLWAGDNIKKGDKIISQV